MYYKNINNIKMPEKPIQEVKELLEDLIKETKSVKSDMNHIKEYIRKIEIRKQLEEENEKKTEDEYVKPSNSWFW
jgi:predicted nuclease with TOPRIM domain